MRPRDVLSNKKMVNVLVDLHATEGVLQVAGYNYGHADDVNAYYAIVLEQHGITQAQFDSSMVWYTAHPQYFQRVYPKVLKRLEKRMDQEKERLNLANIELRNREEEAEALRQAWAERPTAEEMLHGYCYPKALRFYQIEDTIVLCTDSLYELMHMAPDSINRQ